jgi:hypothetical protein
MAAKQRIYETKIINNWKKYIKKNIWTDKDRDGTRRIKINDELISLSRNNIIITLRPKKIELVSPCTPNDKW